MLTSMLSMKYEYRYGREHGSYAKLAELYQDHQNIPTEQNQSVWPCRRYKSDDPIESYRNYCIAEKHYAVWNKGRPKPSWWTLSSMKMKSA